MPVAAHVSRTPPTVRPFRAVCAVIMGPPGVWADALVDMFAREHGAIRTDDAQRLLDGPARPIDLLLREQLAPAAHGARNARNP